VIRRALGQVAHIFDISAGCVDPATDDGVAASVGVVGAVEESADCVVWAHLGGGQEWERRCESDQRGGEAHVWGLLIVWLVGRLTRGWSGCGGR